MSFKSLEEKGLIQMALEFELDTKINYNKT